MSKDKIEKIVRAVADVRSAVGNTLKTSKQVIDKSAKVAGKVLNKETLSNSLSATSKGVDTVASAAKTAGKGVGKLASSLEKASGRLRKISQSLMRKG